MINNKITLVCFFIAFTLIGAKAQNRSTLIFSEAVQTILYEQLTGDLTCDSKKMKYYAQISALSLDTIQINLCKYEPLDTKSTKTKLVKSSSCMVKIKTRELPVLNELDFLYSNIVKRTAKDGLVYEDNYPRSGFFIVFNKYDDTKVVRYGFEK